MTGYLEQTEDQEGYHRQEEHDTGSTDLGDFLSSQHPPNQTYIRYHCAKFISIVLFSEWKGC